MTDVASLPGKWRKKPVVIEAVQYAHGMEDGFVVDGRYYDKSGAVPRAMHRKPAIKTLEGHHEISPGDWIITGVQGERYPCKPDIFAATYEPAEALAARSPAPSAGVGVDDTMAAIMAEVERATRKFPTWPTDPLHAVAVVNEEVGELNKALLQAIYEPHKSTHEDVATEAIQAAAMTYRFVASLRRYTYDKCEQHEQPTPSQHPAAPSVSPAVAGGLDLEGIAALLDHVAGSGRTPEIAADLRKQAILIRRLATAEQPGSAVQGDGVLVGWCALNLDGTAIAWFDGKPMVMPGKVGNEHHRVPLYAGTPPAPAAEQKDCLRQCNMDPEGCICKKAATQPETRGVEGMVLVPREPTGDMVQAAHEEAGCGNGSEHLREVYAAMLSAAPSRPVVDGLAGKDGA